MRSRPGMLVAVCVISIVLGALGVLSGLFQLASLVAAPMLNQAMVSQFKGPQAEAQAEMVTKLNAVTARWRPWILLILAANVLASAGLLIGAIMTLQWKPRGRKLLLAMLLAALAIDLLRVLPEALMQIQVQAIDRQYMARIMSESGQAPGGAAFGEAMGATMVYVTLAVLGGWALVKLICYALGARYLARPQTHALFVSPLTPPQGSGAWQS